MWLEYENQLASGEAEDGMLGRVVRGGVLEQPATAVQLLRAQEFELRHLRQQLHLRDENFGQLRAVLAESESQVAAMQEKLSSEIAVSELDENVALDRVAESRRDLAQAHNTMEMQVQLIQTLKDVSTSILCAEDLRDEAQTDVQNALVKHYSDLMIAQLNLDPENLKGQLQARDVTARELRAAFATRLEGDAVMQLREERDVLRSNLEAVRRDLQAVE